MDCILESLRSRLVVVGHIKRRDRKLDALRRSDQLSLIRLSLGLIVRVQALQVELRDARAASGRVLLKHFLRLVADADLAVVHNVLQRREPLDVVVYRANVAVQLFCNL
jgi:hypothetical protein